MNNTDELIKHSYGCGAIGFQNAPNKDNRCTCGATIEALQAKLREQHRTCEEGRLALEALQSKVDKLENELSEVKRITGYFAP